MERDERRVSERAPMAKTTFELGDLIENRYRILEMIGSGGMGSLYRVSDEARGGELIALKRVRVSAPEAEAPKRVECFKREFQILTRLRHPNLVSVHDYGVTREGELYFTMEWIEGHDLDPAERPLEPAATVPVIVQVCRALAYLHARGVIHGDLKPANVLRTAGAEMQIKIVDFGLALELGAAEAQTDYYSLGYSAPEFKRRGPVDHRADLYSLGALWYALLVGEAPRFVPGSDVLVRLTLEDALRAQDQIPLAVSGVITRLLATSPEKRYASANAVIEEVNEVTGSSYALETRETATSYALRGRFVGRESEMETLQEVWQEARLDEGKLVLVSGEAGVGKTRLVEEFVVQAELEGARVARGQCVESGGSAYRPWREILRVLVRYVEDTDECVLKREGPLLATLLPELQGRDYMAGSVPPADLEPHAAQLRLNAAIARVLRATARSRPTVVVIEDAQWADEATLELLDFLTRAGGQAGLIVCITHREDESGPAKLLSALSGDRVRRIPLRHLAPETTTDLVCSMLGLEQLPASLAERVQHTTGGNAFFVQELVRSLAEDGLVLQRTVEGWRMDRAAFEQARLPDSIHQVAWRRLEHLSAEARQVLRSAAIVGAMFWDGTMEALDGLSRTQVQAALGEGLERELIFERETSSFRGQREFLFAKPAVREVSYESVPQEKRREAHGRVADWLMARSEEEVNEHLGLIAEHLERAEKKDQAAIYLRRAGEQAAAQFANSEAVAYLSRALALTPEEAQAERYALLLAREKVYDVQGERESQRQDLERLEEIAERLDEARQAEAALRQACYFEAVGDYPSAIAAARKAVRLAQLTEDMGRQAEGHWRWGYALWRQAEFEAAEPRLKQALTLARASGERQVEADSLNDLSVIFNIRGHSAEARDYSEKALSIRREIGDLIGESVVLNNLSIITGDQGNEDESVALIEQSLRICREIGDRRGESRALGNLGNYAAASGDYTKARDCQEQALRIRREVGDRQGECIALSNLGYLFCNLGKFTRAKNCLDQSLHISGEIGERRIRCSSLAELGRLCHYLGNDTAALEHCQQALSIAQEIGSHNERAFALSELGHALAGLGRLKEAAESYRQALGLWRESDQQGLAMAPLAGLVKVSLAEGDLVQAQAQAEEIMRYWESKTLTSTGEPFRVYLACYQALCANEDPRAQVMLDEAHSLLQEQAARINDEELRRSFLEDAPIHREIVRQFAMGGCGGED